ncbi:hypothetical protein J5Y05_12250 [Streptomyces sp. RG38]|uniref:Uncharacterized protein n=2 Tax=Streptomyces tagetis TaxID=2820809 RepID=A0A940XHI4_9ACTN|nr:hypothetical protein [Streptomyces sp. RG38]
MAFGTEELRVLRRALALALNPRPLSAEDVQDCLRLAESLDEAMLESARLRAFLVADLARYRAALPGTVTGYLTLLDEALTAGHQPGPDDLAALRALRGNPTAAALLARCAPVLPAARTHLHALPGGRCATVRAATGQQERDPARKPSPTPARPPAQKPAPKPAQKPAEPRRPVPTPGEVFPRRKPKSAPPAPGSRHHLAAG